MAVTQSGYPTTSSGTSPQPQVMNQRLPNAEQHELLASGRITAVLGEGGSAIVYQVWNELLSVKRAVKLLKPTASRESHERFRQEMKIMAQLSHANIINVHSVGKWENLPYIEMDYVDGPSLETLLERKGRIPLVVAVAIAVEVAKALNYTHHHRYRINNIEYHGLLHRDLKPANILLPRFDTVRLSDFGIATLSTVATTSTTQTGKIIGSMQYLAPEQLEEKTVDHRSDIYSFGVLLYELVTGQKMFPERNVSKLVRMRVKNEFHPLTAHGLRLPSELVGVINKTISYKSTDRPASMKKVLSALEHVYRSISDRPPEEIVSRYLNGESVESGIRRKIKRTHNPMKLLLAGGVIAVILMVTVFIGGVAWYGSKNNPAFFEEIQGVFSGSDSDDSTDDGVVRVTIVADKMASSDLDDQSESSGTRRSVKKDASLPTTVPQTGDYAADTLSVLDIHLRDAGIEDTIEALMTLDKQEKYTQVMAFYPHLSPQMRRTTTAQLMKHRAIVGLGQERKTYYDNNQINDGEYYLSKGLYLFSRKQYQRAIWILRVAKTAPAVLINSDELMRETLYYTARAESELYAIRPTEQRQKSTIESWSALQRFLQTDQTDPLFQTATFKIKELREVSE